MDKIYNYSTPTRGIQKTRFPIEKFLPPLTGFFDEFTNIKLEKLTCRYIPKRLSDPDTYNHLMRLKADGFYTPLPLETDEEIANTIKEIESLKIIRQVYKALDMSDVIEEHRYEIDISCYNKVLELMKSKNDYESYIILEIEERFDLINFDYSEIKKELPWLRPHEYNPNGYANEIRIYITGISDKKYYQSMRLEFYCPKPFIEEREYFMKIRNKLKINFFAKNFCVYTKNKKGEWKSKNEKIEL